MIKKTIKTNILLLLSTIILTSCSGRLHQHEFISMDTIVRISLYNSQAPQWDVIENIANKYSTEYDWRATVGQISTLNKTGRILLTDQLKNTLQIALNVAHNTNGHFDPTILPLTILWDFESGGKLPNQHDIKDALRNIDYNRLTLTKEHAELHNAKLDLSAIAKGAVIDHIADWLTTMNYINFIIEAGGDILVSDLKPGQHPWRIWIKHPLNKTYPLAISELGATQQKQAMATSGSYEQNFKIDDTTFHHIINPKTGHPAKNCLSVTVIASSATKADAYATGLCVAGPEYFNTITSQDNIEALMIYKDDESITKIITPNFPVSLQDINL